MWYRDGYWTDTFHLGSIGLQWSEDVTSYCLKLPGCFDTCRNKLFFKNIFITQSRVLTGLIEVFENIIGKGKNAVNQHFLLA